MKLTSADRFGLSRVVQEPGVLPQAARQLDPRLPLRPGEVSIDVEYLNVDAASFRQLRQQEGDDPARVAGAISAIVAARGKLHNPVTGSGGMLVGTVREVSPEHPAFGLLLPGQRLATLVSLTLTPLVLEEIRAVHLSSDRVDARGHAILFASGPWAVLPADLPDTLALAALDVCGAPALVARYARAGQRVLVVGAGKSGALALAMARRAVGASGTLIALDVSPAAVESFLASGLCDVGIACDARGAIEVLERVEAATGGALCDLVVNCASVSGTEMASVLSARDGAVVIFFSMATSFTAATLGAEGAGKDVTLLMGNGFAPGHAALTLDLVRGEPGLRALFQSRFG